MLTVTANELASKFALYLDRVVHGEEICITDHGITDHGHTVARLIGDRMRLRERLAGAVAAGEIELGSSEELAPPVPLAVGAMTASEMLAQDRTARDDTNAGEAS